VGEYNLLTVASQAVARLVGARGRETPRRGGAWKLAALVLLAAALAGAPARLEASDHADPVALRHPESNITGLFFFPRGDRMILIFNVRRALRNPKPYNLEPFEYDVHMDLSTPVSFADASERARYGGSVKTPEAIHPDVTIKILLKDDATLKDISFSGLNNTDQITEYVGVRDDPFVFPRFFEKNIISMVMSIPMTAFPPGQHDFILWGTTSKDGVQEDHVGRSLRSQLPRFGFLNTLAPKDHVQKLMEEKKFWDDVYNFLHQKKEAMPKAIADLIQFTFQIRKYDLVPDVMIYSDRYPPGYPNGRLLSDDVVAQTCAFGDCLLQELSFIEGNWPRKTVNDKPLLDESPFTLNRGPTRRKLPARPRASGPMSSWRFWWSGSCSGS
jgi:hypothetical protein